MSPPRSMFEDAPPTMFGAYCLALDAAMFRRESDGLRMWRRVWWRYAELTGSAPWPVGEPKW